jgi:Probable cobalt transporter subunit (CbtA)
MVRSLLVRGMLVGVVGAAVAFVFAYAFGEPPINSAIAFESGHAAHGAQDPELVSRSVQSTLGLGVAVLLYGSALGGIFALAFAFAYGRIGALAARATSVLVAAGGFVAVCLVPFVKYPANPPAVGDPATIGRRTALYLLMIGVSVLAAIAAVMLGRALVVRLGAWNAALVGIGTFVAVALVAGVVLPGVDEVPEHFPATALWRFRLASVGTQLVLWTTLGLLFGALTERSTRRRAATAPAVPAVPAA